MKIQYIDINKLTLSERLRLKSLTTGYAEKLDRDLPLDSVMVIQIKLHDIEGKRKKYSLHARIDSPSLLLASSRASDWDLARTVHKSMKNIENRLQHKLKLKGHKGVKITQE